MENDKNDKNIIQKAIEDLAKRRSIPEEQVRKEYQEDLKKLKSGDIPDAKRSAEEHEKIENQ